MTAPNGAEKSSFIYVFVAEIPDGQTVPQVVSFERREYISGMKNSKRARESGYAWRLLERGARQALGILPDKVNYRRSSSGRWEAEGFCISLSHSYGACAAAISDMPVGVDIELIRNPRAESFPRRTLTNDEFDEYKELDEDKRVEFLIKKWTQKEAAYKAENAEGGFIRLRAPYSEILELSGRRYFLSVCAESDADFKIIYINGL